MRHAGSGSVTTWISLTSVDYEIAIVGVEKRLLMVRAPAPAALAADGAHPVGGGWDAFPAAFPPHDNGEHHGDHRSREIDNVTTGAGGSMGAGGIMVVDDGSDQGRAGVIR